MHHLLEHKARIVYLGQFNKASTNSLLPRNGRSSAKSAMMARRRLKRCKSFRGKFHNPSIVLASVGHAISHFHRFDWY